jgi:DNA repair exonuclease SbcCD ATPase subunit
MGGGKTGGQEDEESLFRQVGGFRAELETMRARFMGALDKSESEAAQLRAQVISLTRELAEARVAETEARHETEGLRHLARIVEAQHDGAGGGGGGGSAGGGGSGGGGAAGRRSVDRQPRAERPAVDSAVLANAPPDMRELLEQSHADLERTYAELRWWDEHGPQLVHRSDDLAMQLENASRASSEAAAQVAHLRTQLQAAHDEEHAGRMERASLQQACAQLRGRLDDVEGGKAELEELVRRLAAQQHASAARERESYQARLRLAIALSGNGSGNGKGAAAWDETDLGSLAARAEGMQKAVEEASVSLSEAQSMRVQREREIEQLQAQIVAAKEQRDHQRDAAKRWRAMAEQADAVAAIGLQQPHHQPQRPVGAAGQRMDSSSSRSGGDAVAAGNSKGLRLVSASKSRPPRGASAGGTGPAGMLVEPGSVLNRTPTAGSGGGPDATERQGTAVAAAAPAQSSASLTSSSPSITRQLMMHLQSPMPTVTPGAGR